MRASTHSFITHEKGRRDRINLVWHPLRGKPAILADFVNASEEIRLLADPDMILTGLNITSATSGAAVEGGIFTAVVTSTVNAVAISPHTLANNSPWEQITWGTDQEVEWEALIQMDASFDNRLFHAGLMLNPEVVNTAGDNDQVKFFADGDGELDAIVSINNTDTAVSAFQTTLVSQLLHLAIKIDRQGYAHFYVNEQEIDGGNPTFVGNSVDLTPGVATLEASSGGADPKINVLGMAISRAIGV